jgi:nitrogen fixation NifU-like protein
MIFCSDRVRDHFENPRKVGQFDTDAGDVGSSIIGSLVHGQILQFQIRVDNNRVDDARFKAYGCPFIIACGSWLSEWVTGKSLERLGQLHNREICAALRLPPLKIQCAVAAEQALEAAINDYLVRKGKGKIKVES